MILTFSRIALGAAAVSSLCSSATAKAWLLDDFNAGNWFSSFNTEAIQDPTGGFVRYVNQQDAQNSGFMYTTGNQVYVGVDHWNFLDPNGPGRGSVRLRSRNSYNHGLIIGDFAHMPHPACGVWPAFWMFGPNWPGDGEIDIIEGINMNSLNQPTVHTKAGCVSRIGDGGQSAIQLGANCGDGTPVGNIGCPMLARDATSYGAGFNAVGGGVYATLWTSAGVKIWFFPRNAIPADINRGQPDPWAPSWGQPMASWTGCNWDDTMRNMHIMLDTTFCGGWAGGSNWYDSGCSKFGACNAYVASDPVAFTDAYWLVNSIKVYAV